MRTGESLRAMSDADIFRILSEQEPDFSAKICEGLTIEDLDKEAIAEMKTQYARKQENPLFQNYPDEQVLSDLVEGREIELCGTYSAWEIRSHTEISPSEQYRCRVQDVSLDDTIYRLQRISVAVIHND